MIQVLGPDGAIIQFPDGTNPAVMRDAMARHYGGEGATRSFGSPQTARVVPLGSAPPPPQPPGAHPQSEDWWRSITGGLAQGGNAVAAPIGAAYDTEDRLAEMAAHGIHDAGQALGWAPKGQAYTPGQGAAFMHTIRDPANMAAAAAGAFGVDPKTQQGIRDNVHNAAHVLAPGTYWSDVHPSDVRNAELQAAQATGGSIAARQLADVVDYEPETGVGRFLHRGASMLPGAALPGSWTQRLLAVAAPTVGATIAGEGARAMGAPLETVGDAELLATLLGAGVGGKGVSSAENAVANVGDMVSGPRAVPTSGSAADLAAMLRGRNGGNPPSLLSAFEKGPGDIEDAFANIFKGGPSASGEGGPTFKQSDLQGAANLLKQHVGRVGRASGEDFGAMGSRVGGMGDQAMLADALSELGRNVADRGSYGQQFLGNQLNQRQLGVQDGGQYVEPSAGMRLDAGRRAALGVQDGAFNTADALTQAQQASAGPLYDAFRAQPPVSSDAIADFRGPDFDNAYGRAATIARRNFAPIPDQPGPFIDPQTLNLVKQGFDDLASDGKLQGIGANEQGSARNFAQAFRGRLDELYPDTYPRARAAFAGPAAVKDAIDFGRGAYTMDPAELASGLADLSQSERQGANVGFYQAGRDATLGKDQGINSARVLGANTPDMMARNQALMGDNYGDWASLLGNENTFSSTRQRVLGGSATSRNMLGAQDAAEGEGINPFEATAGLVRAAHGDLDGVVETAGNAGKLTGLAKLFAPKPPQMTEGTADVLGTILGTRGALMDPQTAALIQGLMDSAKGPNFNAGIVRPAALLSAPTNQDQGGQ